MVAIKQAPISTSLDLKGDDSARIASSTIRRGESEQRVSSVRGEAQKKAKELLDKLLLDKTKQRKKQGEQQPALALLVPAMVINSQPLSAPLKLHLAQPPAAENLLAGEVLAPMPEAMVPTQKVTVEQPPAVQETAAKPATLAKLVGEKEPATMVAERKNGLVMAEALIRPNVIPQDNGESQLAALSSTTRENPAILKVSVPTVSAEGDKAAMAHTPLPTPAPDMPRVVTRDALFNTVESGRESASSAPFADKKESAPGDERPQGGVTQPSTTPAATLSDAVEIKAPPQTLPEGMVAEGMMAKGEPMTEHRTLSYTFTQWKNSPMVTFELSGAGELTAMTASAEVQQALQENHHLLESENPLHFRDDEQNKERRGQQQSEHEDEA
ncbi:type III secretion protein [Yersinia mollaretii]|uniref:Type III secretion protein n=1 Tax=Yersinia mollaretii TaxID=33060 RepID=A0AA44CN81_YERMO|nr:hypothetical protein [Yersinia mollaretii]NIL23884.1 type III secretion protein [Yersinia mollaretii]CNJ24254.1 type III secretion protein [Yersinia mollaretii]CQQ67318.1 type III secretion protein [Yersinia mollaretii]